MSGERADLAADTGGVYNVQFLCTGNSARSILASAILYRVARAAASGRTAPAARPRAA